MQIDRVRLSRSSVGHRRCFHGKRTMQPCLTLLYEPNSFGVEVRWLKRNLTLKAMEKVWFVPRVQKKLFLRLKIVESYDCLHVSWITRYYMLFEDNLRGHLRFELFLWKKISPSPPNTFAFRIPKDFHRATTRHTSESSDQALPINPISF